ncbi:transcriptional regulator, AraC family [Gloeocapsa sp. PCC 7428]|uniref:helix-turn-helix domain-containing protein n=1 Tax=Gloeocapsa sp. PCC 7428 TaxID=1173026 RepID=UPI0002A5E460|nr:helix-turn-helix domain-containing protein [Gloeocapsa sp. PCC 7428]AFZ31555.1 transcriptional regulator, AraC family [Gloeocapsa sp. PCC 7428]
MAYYEFVPAIALADDIDAFWYFPQKEIPHCHRVLPDGCIDLIFRFQRSSWGGGITNPLLTVYGPTDRFKLVNIEPCTTFIGVRFKPGIAASYLGLSAVSLFQQEVMAQECSARFVNMFDRLCECTSVKQALSIFQNAVLKLKMTTVDDVPRRVREAVKLLCANERQMQISDVASVIGVSERTLRRDIVASVGLSPKMLAQILRFQSAIALLRSKKQLSLCNIALQNGYADQSHMTREFQAFSGLSPTAFIQQ